ncbi:hypothetical protein [Acidovorax sp. RAC01]|uniref:hypothetical protein n=1 Tax=Acidovorax sp. RAC01 TaxID=1842533 RepID=UPI0008560D91|nr:hypothetical protein [Acidovorax sp. RAC01]AOG22913.1 CHASE2 domain protein [Acidovorax sp. RAC01]
MLERLDRLTYDLLLQAPLTALRDDRVLMVGVDDKCIARVGQWPHLKGFLGRTTSYTKR